MEITWRICLLAAAVALVESRNVGISWKDCGGNKAPIFITKLTLVPGDLHIPGNFTASVGVKIQDEVTKTVNLKLDVYKKVFGTYFKLPCDHKFGSCTYHNLCDVLARKFKHGCPGPLKHCTCPFAPGDFEFDDIHFHIPKPHHVPHFLEDGHYKVKASLTDGPGSKNNAGCLEVELKVHVS